MYFCDSHTHTRLSSDSRAALPHMVRAAEELGLDALYVTDHCDLLGGDGTPNDTFDWAAAFRQFREARELSSGRTELFLGLELGSAPYDGEISRRILREGGDGVDFVLGSIHNWIGLHDNIELYYTDFTHRPALCRQAMEMCMDRTRRLVTEFADCYDSLAHITYPIRYIRRDGEDASLWDYEDRVRDIFTLVAQSGHALEVNTCRGTTMEGWTELLRLFRECGGEFVTLGSDAHHPRDVAKGLREATDFLRQAGFRYVTTFRGRKPVPHSI